jgi:hypothetical protein
LIFGRRVLPSTSGVFATQVVTRGVDVCINSKQYFKQGRALRIETVINDPSDLGVLRRLSHFARTPAQGR